MNRSDFIKTLAVGTAGSFLLPAIPQAEEMTGKPVNDVADPSKVVARFVYDGPGASKRVALTLDDGPTPRVTESILKDLADRKAKATFFMIGRRVKEFPAIAKDVLAAGHEIGNHTYTHPKLAVLSNDRVHAELRKTQTVIGDTLNVYPSWFRPPYGSFRKSQGAIALDMGLGVAYWSVDTHDWRRQGVDRIVERAVGPAQSGSIILGHDLHAMTAEAMPGILDGLLEKGYTFATLTELLGEPYPDMA
ncbi:MAG: polysaccharide deacetylase family protein [Verrucomicrobiae bacterium]|nr:polysaccharide deacetylase family protein [Verrucomicrobiae bacterium]